MRESIAAAGERWRREYLPIHFTKRATRRYGYTPRGGQPGSGRAFRKSYSWHKLKRGQNGQGVKAIGEVKPLVWSGESRGRARHQSRIKATATSSKAKAVVTIPAPALNFRGPGSKADMLKEIRTVIPEETRALATTFVRAVDGRLSRYFARTR